MSDITLRVRNFLGVVKADIPLTGITLVGGENGSGKSSLLEAASCAATQTPHARGMATMKASAALLREGADAGSVTLEYPGGAVRVIYPGCEIDQSGKPPQFGTGLGIGAVRYMGLKDDARLREVTERFQASPTNEDFASFLAAKEVPADKIASLWERIDMSGWDAVHKEAVEHGTKLKGRWEQISGRRWGVSIARTWMPAPLLEGENYDVEAEEAAWAEAKADLNDRTANAALDDARRAGLQAEAATLDDLKQQMVVKQSEIAALSEQAERLLEKRAVHADVGEGPNYIPCPACGVALKYNGSNPKAPKLEAITKHATPSEVREAQAALRSIDEDRKRISASLQAVTQEQARIGARITKAELAQQDLAAAAEGTVTKEEIDAARDAALLAERKVNALKKLGEARKVVAGWEAHQHVIQALAPDGVRQQALSRRLSEINAELGRLSALARFGDVALTMDFSATYNGRPYALLAESEKWRVDLTLTLLFGQKEGAPFVLIDRMDVLHQASRPGVLLALKQLQLPALIACTAKDRAALPDLERAKIGHVRWLTAGVLDEPKA